MKKCPFCAEEIQDEAIKCKHCGEWFEKDVQAPPSQIVEVREIEPPEAQPPIVAVSPESDEEIKRKKEAGLKQCPSCGKWDAHKAYVEDGAMADWCPHCKKSLEAMNNGITPQVRPWIRYWARYFDYLIAGFIFFIVIFATFPSVIKFFILKKHIMLLPLFIVFYWTFLEAGFLATWGYTPGKWLLGVSIRDKNGEKPSYGVAWRRAINVYFRGIGMGFPIATLITMEVAWNKLTRDGITSWDKVGEIDIVHHKINLINVIIFLAITIAIVLAEIIGK